MRTRGLISASNSSRNSVSAECTGTYADGPRKQIVVILYGNGTASSSSRSLGRVRHRPGQIDSPTGQEQVEVLRGTVALDDALQDPLQPRAALAARHALAARLVGVEASSSVRAAAGMSVVSSITMIAPEPSIDPAAPTSLPSNGRSS